MTDGVELDVHVEGRDDADLTVVLVHGFAARKEELEPQRQVVGRTCRTVAYDQRGHGRSGWGGRRSARLDRLGEDLATVLETRTQGPVVLVGHSMGGMAVMALASRRPDLVRRRVVGAALMSTSAGRLAQTALPRPAAELLGHSPAADTLGLLAWSVAPVAQAWHPFRRRRVQRWISAQLFGPDGADPETTRTVVRMWQTTRRSITASFYPALLEHDRVHALGVLRDVPVLVLTGTHDATIPAGHSREIAEVLGDRARLVEVPRAGHMVNLTHADATNRALLELVDRVRSDNVRDHRS